MAVAVPVAPPKHATSTWLVVTVSAAAGCVIVTFAVAVHRLASVTVTVYVPAISPVAVIVVWTGTVFHE